MSKTTQKKKPNQRMTLKEVLDALDSFITKYESDSSIIWYWSCLNSLGITQSMYNHYVKDYKNEKVTARFNKLRSMQESRLVEGALDKNSNVNPVVALKILSCRHGWIEKKDERRLELEEKKLSMGIVDGSRVEVSIVPASVHVKGPEDEDGN